MLEFWDRTTLSLRRPPTPSEKSEEDQQHHPQSGKSKGKKGMSCCSLIHNTKVILFSTMICFQILYFWPVPLLSYQSFKLT